jgi:hypothetical protein
MVAPTWITPGCVQPLENKERFHTAWTQSGPESFYSMNQPLRSEVR